MNNPYANTQRTVLENSPANQAEGAVLIELARRMDEAVKKEVSAQDLFDLIRRNWRAWTYIQSAQLSPECDTPKELRENLLSLCNFIDRHTVDIISSRDRGKIAVLVNINRQVGAGLMSSPQNAAASDESDPSGPPADSPRRPRGKLDV